MAKAFQIESNYQPAGDQPTAIAELVTGLEDGEAFQTLLGVTGSGKNLYHGQCHRSGATPNDYFGA